jgi:hypothetical protein
MNTRTATAEELWNQYDKARAEYHAACAACQDHAAAALGRAQERRLDEAFRALLAAEGKLDPLF